MAEGVLDVDNVKGPRMALTVDDGTNSSQVTTTSDHAEVARLKLDEIHDLATFNVQLDGVINLDQGIRITDGATIMGSQEGNAFRSNLDTANLAKLVLQ